MHNEQLRPLSVSVVIPAYNEVDRIIEAIRAIQAQTYQPEEIIIVDNNSSDGTAEAAKAFKGVRVITERRQGIAYARTAGFNAARGDIIARTDADSVPDPDWIEQMVEAFMLHDIDVVSGPIYYYDMPARETARKLEKMIRGSLAKFTKEAKFLAGANMGISREAWQEVRSDTCTDALLHEDLDLAIHMHARGQKIGFARNMHVATSARRMSGPTKDFYRYMKRYEQTFYAHGIYEASLKVPIMIYLPIQPFLRVVRRAYDEDTQRLSLRKLVSVEDAKY